MRVEGETCARLRSPRRRPARLVYRRRRAPAVGALELATTRECSCEIVQCLEPRRIVLVEKVDRALEQSDRGRKVRAPSRSVSRGGELRSSASSELALRVALVPELGPQAHGLLEVVPENLVELERRHPCALEPGGELLVEARTQLLGHRPYAASRIRMCRKRNASSPGINELSGRMSSLRIRLER